MQYYWPGVDAIPGPPGPDKDGGHDAAAARQDDAVPAQDPAT